MTELDDRLASLPPERRQLLRRLLTTRAATAAASVPSAKTNVSRSAVADAPPSSNAVATPGDAKAVQKQAYHEINRSLDAGEFGRFTHFLNFGYAADDNPQHAVVALPPRCLNRHSVKLVLELVGDCDLRGRQVLDVGCGRGGTLVTITQFFEPAQGVGVDLCRAAIAFCRATHAHSSLRFLEGDAEHLPLVDRSFDVVTNVESSHAYPHVEDFFRQVFRVLRPGGCLLQTDLRPASEWRLDSERLRDIGFQIEHDRDITSNVLRACEESAAVRHGAFTAVAAPLPLEEFLAVPGSSIHAGMQAGVSQYRIRRLRKPERVSHARGAQA